MRRIAATKKDVKREEIRSKRVTRKETTKALKKEEFSGFSPIFWTQFRGFDKETVSVFTGASEVDAVGNRSIESDSNLLGRVREDQDGLSL